MRWSVDLEPFEIGVYPVTQEQLAEMLGVTGSHPRRPATEVSWLRAIRFCNAASEWEGLDPARYDAYRVFRGGGFADDAWSVRASTRRGGAPRMHHEDVGFRVARGGFDATDAAQGWSAEADRERAAIDGPLPSGWTPRR